jgi:hypothetical protein
VFTSESYLPNGSGATANIKAKSTLWLAAFGNLLDLVHHDIVESFCRFGVDLEKGSRGDLKSTFPQILLECFGAVGVLACTSQAKRVDEALPPSQGFPSPSTIT